MSCKCFILIIVKLLITVAPTAKVDFCRLFIVFKKLLNKLLAKSKQATVINPKLEQYSRPMWLINQSIIVINIIIYILTIAFSYSKNFKTILLNQILKFKPLVKNKKCYQLKQSKVTSRFLNIFLLVRIDRKFVIVTIYCTVLVT